MIRTMKIMLGILALMLSQTITIYAQKKFTIESATFGRYVANPSQPTSLQWKNADSYVYLKKDTIWEKAISQKQPTAWLSSADLKKADEKFYYFPSFVYVDGMLRMTYNNKLHIYDPEKKQFILKIDIPADAENTDFCSASKYIAYTKGQNLFVANAKGEKQVTSESKDGIECGKSVHRDEFGISKGTFWSSTGRYIAFYRNDESMVTEYPLVDYMPREAQHSPVRYPMAGLTSHQVTIGIYDTETGRTTFLNTGKPDDHYLTNISWSPDDRHLYVAELNREQNHMKLNRYSIETGQKELTLFEEKSNTYVEPLHPIIFSKVNPNQFYYWSRKDGWFHIYLYNSEGKLIRQVTKGDWEVTSFYGEDEKGKNIYIGATKENAVERHIYQVDTSNGKLTRLTGSAGIHNASFSSDKKFFIDRWEAFDIAGRQDLYNLKGELLEKIYESEDPFADYELGENRLFTIKAADNKTDLYCRMILPPDFDEQKKYPVIVYVYGGPHAQMINSGYKNSVNLWQYYMASQGYITFTLDNRGSANRGRAFEEIIHRQSGVTETADQMKGIEYLKSLSYVDHERIGVHGWSYGGYMTLNLMLRHPDVFKVGVAGGPVVDWSMYEVMYGERYMDMPQENPEGYKETSMITHAGKLKGKLLIIHGAQDGTVVMQHSMKFIRECVSLNKPVDFFAYPTHKHNVSGRDRIHLMEKISRYFLDYL